MHIWLQVERTEMHRECSVGRQAGVVLVVVVGVRDAIDPNIYIRVCESGQDTLAVTGRHRQETDAESVGDLVCPKHGSQARRQSRAYSERTAPLGGVSTAAAAAVDEQLTCTFLASFLRHSLYEIIHSLSWNTPSCSSSTLVYSRMHHL